eukprot:CAMPEP_0202973834 /NCGR_PEP_ID=MMETSP1396-20130829/54499_1 /ASSEMBLY_ACC=CAM_ASM_000872 /TAXON_ID= /ORGANISM="Pseudokeronopsis sp., Strain Brazil" /LENGTH=111 /DNA_ID=CAMNT_0049706609 /DNA_START=349 /DNA_END=684 /DNA_ORIENTATION=-
MPPISPMEQIFTIVGMLNSKSDLASWTPPFFLRADSLLELRTETAVTARLTTTKAASRDQSPAWHFSNPMRDSVLAPPRNNVTRIKAKSTARQQQWRFHWRRWDFYREIMD